MIFISKLEIRPPATMEILEAFDWYESGNLQKAKSPCRPPLFLVQLGLGFKDLDLFRTETGQIWEE